MNTVYVTSGIVVPPGTQMNMRNRHLMRRNNPGAVRVLRALLESAQTRKEIDRISGCSNGPHVIMTLRRFLEIDLPFVPATPRPGGSDVRGVYRLAPGDPPLVRFALYSSDEELLGDAREVPSRMVRVLSTLELMVERTRNVMELQRIFMECVEVLGVPVRSAQPCLRGESGWGPT